MRRPLAVFGTLMIVGTALAVSPAPAAAGLLEFLFGRPAAVAPAPAGGPMEISVRPRRWARPRASRRRPAAEARVPRRVASIDPVKVPDWHLHDPTLRRGDILVLTSGPVVFDGFSGPEHQPEDFVRLDRTRLVSGAERRIVRMMVSGIWSAAEITRTASARRRAAPRLEASALAR